MNNNGTEVCDDGNTASGDGCSSSCVVETLNRSLVIQLDSVCTLPQFQVVCFSADAGTQDLLMASAGVPYATMASSCRAHYDALCGMFGATAADALDCDTFCDFWSNAIFPSFLMSSETGVVRCQSPGTQAGEMCLPTLEYSLMMACEVSDRAAQYSLWQKVHSFVFDSLPHETSLQDVCRIPAKPNEQATIEVVDSSDSPLSTSDPACFDKADCRYACFNHGFGIQRMGPLFQLSPIYAGSCDCAGILLEGRAHYAGGYLALRMEGMTNRSFNESSDFVPTLVNMSVSPVPLVNAFEVTFKSMSVSETLECSYLWEFLDAGTGILGLPTQAETDSTSPRSTAEFVGFSADVSEGLAAILATVLSRPIRNNQGHTESTSKLGELQSAQNVGSLGIEAAEGIGRGLPKEEHILLSHALHSLSEMDTLRRMVDRASVDKGSLWLRESLVEVLQGGCPVASSNCLFACISSGFSTDKFGAQILLTWLYEGECDCSSVFWQSADGTTIVGTMVAGTDPSIEFSEAVMLTGDDDGVKASASLSVFGEFIGFTVEPDMCTYLYKLTIGSLLGVSGSEALVQATNSSDGPTLALTFTTLSSLPSTSCDFAQGDCNFLCLHPDFSGVTDQGQLLSVETPSPGNGVCTCETYNVNAQLGEQLGEDNAVYDTPPGWAFEGDRESNAILFTYATPQGRCNGAWNVSGTGQFLGIPISGALENNTETITTGQSQQAAAGLTVGIAAAVGAATVAAVGSAVGGGVGAAGVTAAGTGGAGGVGGTGGIASGAHHTHHNAGGNAATIGLLHQAQFLSLSGRIGGPDAQPEPAREMSKGLAWTNWHIFSSEDYFGKTNYSAAGGQGGKDGEEREQGLKWWQLSRDESCTRARNGDRELGGTVVMALIAFAVTWVVREGVCALVKRYRVRKGQEPGPKIAPFPSWETMVLIVTFQGLAESVGDAVSSGCPGYELAGGIVLFLLLASSFTLGIYCVINIRRKKCHWEHITLRQGLADLNEARKNTEHKTTLERIQLYFIALTELTARGEWVATQKPTEEEIQAEWRFIARVGGAFGDFHGAGWWYGLWNLGRMLCMGVILGSVLAKTTNATLCLVLSSLDAAIVIGFHPDADWLEVVKRSYMAAMNVSVTACALAYISDQISDALYSSVFFYISIFSLIPAVLQTLAGNLLQLFKMLSRMMRWCTRCFGNSEDAATVGAWAIVTMGQSEKGHHSQMFYSARDSENEHKNGATPMKI